MTDQSSPATSHRPHAVAPCRIRCSSGSLRVDGPYCLSCGARTTPENFVGTSEYCALMPTVWTVTDNSARELRDSRLAADFITLNIDGINPDPVMRWAELRSVLRHLEDHAGRVFTTADRR